MPLVVLFVGGFFLFQPSDGHDKCDTVLEVSDVEGDTLDPQTGLFYRSGQPATVDPIKNSPAQGGPQSVPPSQTEGVQSSPPIQARPPQLHSKPQLNQPSSSSTSLPATPLTKKLPKLREQNQSKSQTVMQIPKERPLLGTTQTGPKVTGTGTPSKPQLTPQLPKLQQAPTSHHRPLHTAMSQPPPLQAHHPVSAEKSSSSQVNKLKKFFLASNAGGRASLVLVQSNENANSESPMSELFPAIILMRKNL